MNAFIASNVSATHFQVRITLPTNRFVASDERILCWVRVLMKLEANAFRAGDEYFCAGNERTENARSSFSHTHAWLAWSTQGYSYSYTSDFQAEFISRRLATYLGNGRYHIARIQQVSRCTTASSVALNWSSRLSKQRKP